jgi:hypothetical protein
MDAHSLASGVCKLALTGLLCSWTIVASADADGSDASGTRAAPRPADWQLAVGIGPELLLGDACQRNDDVVGCTAPVAFVRADAMVERRVRDWLWLGPVLGFGFEPGSGRGSATGSDLGITRTTEEHRRMWLLGARAKAQLDAADGAWVALQLAALAIEDREQAFDGDGRPAGERMTRSWGAAPAIVAGYDFALTELLSLGVSLGACWVAIGEPDTERTHYVYDAGPAARLGIELRVLP